MLMRVRELGHSDNPNPLMELAFDTESAPTITICAHNHVAFGDGALWQTALQKGDVITIQPASPVRIIIPNP